MAANVLLDPLHFGGVNTSYDAFSHGKAIVTLPGVFQRGRYTYACYRRMGVDGPVATSVEDYVARAVRIATDADYCHSLEALVRERSDVLFEDVDAASALAEFFVAASQRCR
jgi:predicted O-linked N-acetylglucosamine transferase (SPINDLY family)